MEAASVDKSQEVSCKGGEKKGIKKMTESAGKKAKKDSQCDIFTDEETRFREVKSSSQPVCGRTRFALTSVQGNTKESSV